MGFSMEGAGSGAAAGSSFGPWGAVAGGVLGGFMGGGGGGGGSVSYAPYDPFQGVMGQEAERNLFGILRSKGKTDPLLMNQMLGEISRGGQAQLQGIDQNLATRGWENSGVGAALRQASTGATMQRRSELVANQAQLEEQRKRTDLELLLKMFIQPNLDYAGIQASKYGIDQQTKAQKDAATMGMIGDLMAMFGSYSSAKK